QENFTQRPIPKNLSLFGCLGGLSLVAFCIQVGTGIFLMCFYIPSASEAFSSLQYIKHSAQFGWLLQKLHLAGAQIMVGCVLGHMLRVLFKGIYKKPRELHWVSGTSLFLLTLVIAYTGSQLTAEGFYTWNVRTSANVNLPSATDTMEDVEALASLTTVTKYAVGETPDGKKFSSYRRPFFYAMHIALIPLVMAMFMGFHFTMVRRTGIAGPL
ncbi:MAG: cytochrome b N-terminal domain-containing protein, partial [Planctomycetes bacterium]|nr:cytochrome b N-terminal domain-containing protein [Planctomycetota bacterium]